MRNNKKLLKKQNRSKKIYYMYRNVIIRRTNKNGIGTTNNVNKTK